MTTSLAIRKKRTCNPLHNPSQTCRPTLMPA